MLCATVIFEFSLVVLYISIVFVKIPPHQLLFIYLLLLQIIYPHFRLLELHVDRTAKFMLVTSEGGMCNYFLFEAYVITALSCS